MEDKWTNEMLFIQLVMQNQQMAMMSLGKLENPIAGKIEKNIEFAKLSIDTLDMIKEKTKGNLSEYEEKFLNETLRELKLAFVSETEKN
ncbi:MAG TPA: DUF1844 domain-containing protein [Ignavibacteriaceae bacterium]|nr:DUF1844 domain-containing protein [Ignavibacteriaceae bacterium]